MLPRTLAQIQIPLDIPEVRVVSTEITSEGELLIQVESEIECTICGICGKDSVHLWARPGSSATASIGVGSGDVYLYTSSGVDSASIVGKRRPQHRYWIGTSNGVHIQKPMTAIS